MNKIIIIAVFIFWGAVSFFFANNLINKGQTPITPNNAVQLPQQTPTGEIFTFDLVAKHNTVSDCWVTSGNTVYNVTNYLNAHPGGRGQIIPYCGADITAAFNAQGHSNNAANILKGLAIGVIGAAVIIDNPSPVLINGIITTPTPNNTISQPANTTLPSGETLTLALVAQHNTAADCWVTYGNNVYNVTGYLSAHPGGRDRIIPYCGADIGAAFSAQGHSNNASNILNGLAIGVIGQTISADNTTPPPIVNNGRGSNDDDDENDDDD